MTGGLGVIRPLVITAACGGIPSLPARWWATDAAGMRRGGGAGTVSKGSWGRGTGKENMSVDLPLPLVTNRVNFRLVFPSSLPTHDSSRLLVVRRTSIRQALGSVEYGI